MARESSTSTPASNAASGAAPLPSLASFARPRYWPTWVFVSWLRLTAIMPWRVALEIHKRLGRAMGVLLPKRRRIVRRNIELCFPQLGTRELDLLVRRHFECVGAFIAETAFGWFAAPDRLAHLVRIEGVEHLRAALVHGKGVVLYSGHFTPLEICVPAIKPLVPLFAFMFRGRKNPLLNAMQTRGRRRAAHISFDNASVRVMLRMLRDNAVVFQAADQAPAEGGELLPFFGEPALTSTATSRIARVSGATILPMLYARLPDDSGYVVRFSPPLPGVPSEDAVADTARLTAVLEDFVRQCPEQYFWVHRKFKSRPAALPDVYTP